MREAIFKIICIILLHIIFALPIYADSGGANYSNVSMELAEIEREYQSMLESVNQEIEPAPEDLHDVQAVDVKRIEELESLVRELTEKNIIAENQKNEPAKLKSMLDDRLSASEEKKKMLEKNIKILEKDLEIFRTKSRLQTEAIEKLQFEKSRIISEIEREKKLRKKYEWRVKLVEAKAKRDALVIKKERINMHYNLAVVYDKNEMYEDAEREYLKCLEIDENEPYVHYNLGVLYANKLNRNDRAMKHYTKFLDINPAGDDANSVREWILRLEEAAGIR